MIGYNYNQTNMNKLLIICGPTATGKTSLGIYLAKKFNGEIVSADSRQVYKGVDVATGKDLPVGFKYQVSSIKKRRLATIFLKEFRFGCWM